jgi:hypothetical protein
MKSVSYEYKLVRNNGSTISTHLECRLAQNFQILTPLSFDTINSPNRHNLVLPFHLHDFKMANVDTNILHWLKINLILCAFAVKRLLTYLDNL